MNWDAIVAISEFVGALSVLITLVYLAIQTRENTKVIRSRANWDAQMSYAELNTQLGDGGLICEIQYKLQTGAEDLSPYEKYLAHRFFRSWFQRLEAQFALYQSGILQEEVWELRRSHAKAIIGNPLINKCWEIDKKNSVFTQAFIQSIDQAVGAELRGYLGTKD